MKKRIVLAIMFIVFGATVAFAMDEEKYLSDMKLSVYPTIVINDFDIKNVDIEHIDADEMKTLEPMMPQLVKGLSEAIQNKLKEDKKFTNIYLNQKQATNAVRLEGKIVKLNGGIGGVKWLLGFMTPKNARTYIAITGRLVDAESGKELATFADTNTGQWFGKNYADYFPEMTKELGESITEFIINNY